MPVKIGERHVAGVGDGKVVPHLAPGQGLGVAPLGDGHPQVGGLVIVGHLDDLPRVLQRFIKNGPTDLPIGRRCGFHNLIPAQGQRLGCGDATGVRGDIAIGNPPLLLSS